MIAILFLVAILIMIKVLGTHARPDLEHSRRAGHPFAEVVVAFLLGRRGR